MRLAPGDQVVADGRLVSGTDGLQLDESILTGEATAVAAAVGDEVRSGSFVVEGTGSFEVAAVGAESYAERIAGTAREFRHPRSPLERAIDRLLYVLLGVMVPLGAMLIVALWKQDVAVRHAVETAVAGMVTLIPEGLILLVSVTYAAAAVRMARAGALSQQLNAIESLASVDTICIDKTGTLTEPRRCGSSRSFRLPERPRRSSATALGRFAAASEARNPTLAALAAALAGRPRSPPTRSSRSSRGGAGAGRGSAASATSSARRSSSRSASSPRPRARTRRPAGGSSASASRRARFPDDPDAGPPPLRPLGLAVLAEELRPETRETIAYLVEQGVEIVVLSGDAADDGRPRSRPTPASPSAGRRSTARTSRPTISSSTGSRRRSRVVGRISPEGKRRVVESLRRRGRYVAMVGDGVNDVPGAEGVAPLDRAGLRARRWRRPSPTSCSSTATSRRSRRWSPRAAGSSATSSA